jgi:hypothetical protein
MVIILDFDRNVESILSKLENEEKSTLKNGILSIFEKTISQEMKPVKVFFESNDNNERIIGIVTSSNSRQNELDMYSVKVICNFLQNLIYSRFGFTVTIAVGKAYFGLEDIRKSYEEAMQALKYKFLMGNNSVIIKSEIEGDGIGKSKHSYYKKHLKKEDAFYIYIDKCKII